MSANPDAPGIHGKLPSHGDFITRRLPRSFVDPWDDWLQRAISASKAELGERWLDVYLTSPIWSFVLECGVCGSNAWAGVLMPSVDRVGRYFPLTVAVAVDAEASPPEIVTPNGGWFSRAGALALSSLEHDENFSLDTFDASVAELGVPAAHHASGVQWGQTLMNTRVKSAAMSIPPLGAHRGVCVALDSAAGAGTAFLQLAHGLLEGLLGRYSMWWSDGSELVRSCLLFTGGLPLPAAYTTMLDGRLNGEHWLLTTAAPYANDGAQA